MEVGRACCLLEPVHAGRGGRDASAQGAPARKSKDFCFDSLGACWVQEALLSLWGGRVLGFMETFSLRQLNKQLWAFADEINEFSHLDPGQSAACAVGPALEGRGELL